MSKYGKIFEDLKFESITPGSSYYSVYHFLMCDPCLNKNFEYDKMFFDTFLNTVIDNNLIYLFNIPKLDVVNSHFKSLFKDNYSPITIDSILELERFCKNTYRSELMGYQMLNFVPDLSRIKCQHGNGADYSCSHLLKKDSYCLFLDCHLCEKDNFFFYPIFDRIEKSFNINKVLLYIGPGGTGKTTKLLNDNANVTMLCLAPTNAACDRLCEVLKNKNVIFNRAYSRYVDQEKQIYDKHFRKAEITVMTMGLVKKREHRFYDTVYIDECGQCNLYDIIECVNHLNYNRLIMSGDPFQNQPFNDYNLPTPSCIVSLIMCGCPYIYFNTHYRTGRNIALDSIRRSVYGAENGTTFESELIVVNKKEFLDRKIECDCVIVYYRGNIIDYDGYNVMTVDTSNGQEFDTVAVDIDFESNTPFNYSIFRCNVALTRHRKKLYLLVNEKFTSYNYMYRYLIAKCASPMINKEFSYVTNGIDSNYYADVNDTIRVNSGDSFYSACASKNFYEFNFINTKAKHVDALYYSLSINNDNDSESTVDVYGQRDQVFEYYSNVKDLYKIKDVWYVPDYVKAFLKPPVFNEYRGMPSCNTFVSQFSKDVVYSCTCIHKGEVVTIPPLNELNENIYVFGRNKDYSDHVCKSHDNKSIVDPCLYQYIDDFTSTKQTHSLAYNTPYFNQLDISKFNPTPREQYKLSECKDVIYLFIDNMVPDFKDLVPYIDKSKYNKPYHHFDMKDLTMTSSSGPPANLYGFKTVEDLVKRQPNYISDHSQEFFNSIVKGVCGTVNKTELLDKVKKEKKTRSLIPFPAVFRFFQKICYGVETNACIDWFKEHNRFANVNQSFANFGFNDYFKKAKLDNYDHFVSKDIEKFDRSLYTLVCVLGYFTMTKICSVNGKVNRKWYNLFLNCHINDCFTLIATMTGELFCKWGGLTTGTLLTMFLNTITNSFATFCFVYHIHNKISFELKILSPILDFVKKQYLPDIPDKQLLDDNECMHDAHLKGKPIAYDLAIKKIWADCRGDDSFTYSSKPIDKEMLSNFLIKFNMFCESSKTESCNYDGLFVDPYKDQDWESNGKLAYLSNYFMKFGGDYYVLSGKNKFFSALREYKNFQYISLYLASCEYHKMLFLTPFRPIVYVASLFLYHRFCEEYDSQDPIKYYGKNYSLALNLRTKPRGAHYHVMQSMRFHFGEIDNWPKFKLIYDYEITNGFNTKKHFFDMIDKMQLNKAFQVYVIDFVRYQKVVHMIADGEILVNSNIDVCQQDHYVFLLKQNNFLCNLIFDEQETSHILCSNDDVIIKGQYTIVKVYMLEKRDIENFVYNYTKTSIMTVLGYDPRLFDFLMSKKIKFTYFKADTDSDFVYSSIEPLCLLQNVCSFKTFNSLFRSTIKQHALQKNFKKIVICEKYPIIIQCINFAETMKKLGVDVRYSRTNFKITSSYAC